MWQGQTHSAAGLSGFSEGFFDAAEMESFNMVFSFPDYNALVASLPATTAL